jgi:hypothetical protein
MQDQITTNRGFLGMLVGVSTSVSGPQTGGS